MRQPDPWAMLDAMPPGLLEQWQAFNAVEPIGQDWLQSAMICQQTAALSALYQMAKGVKKVKWPKLTDFMPVAAPEPVEQAKQQTAANQQTAAAIAGAFARGRD